MLGANDRNNPDALTDALAVKTALSDFRIIYVAENMFGPDYPDATLVKEDEQARIDAVADSLGFEGPAGVNLWKLYAMGFTFDRVHPTDEGKKWIAASVYMYLQNILPLTPISRNIAWLWNLKETNPTSFAQFIDMSLRQPLMSPKK